MSPRRLPFLLLLILSALFVAACGGGDDSKSDSADRGYAPARGYGDDSAPIVGSKEFALKPSLVPPGYSSAGGELTPSYEPEGEIVADNGFRPQANGFAFENYGNDADPENMTPVEVRDMFGAEQVCLGGEGADCQLTPAAQQWMENANDAMAGGHCQGFSVAALRMYAQHIDPADYGAPTTPELDIQDNGPLQSEIAESFIYQALPSVIGERVRGTPTEVLERLREALKDDSELYTLGIYKADFTGGHAITPFAVEDQGDGKYAILVYDNNFPGATRAVQVDTNTDSWSYVGGTNPQNLGEVYEGDAKTGTLELDPTIPGEGVQACPFCSGKASEGPGKAGALPKAQQYTELTLDGDPQNHPHLVFEDGQGRQTGIVDGVLKQEIPDIEVVKVYAVENWDAAPEPRYRMPEGKDYTITVDGTDLEKTARPTIDLVGNNLYLEVDDITIEPGQKDRMQLPGGYGLTYEANNDTEEAPNIFAGVVNGDEAYVFGASAVGIQKGSAVSLFVVQEEKVVILDSTLSRGIGGKKAAYIVNLTKLTADGTTSQWTKAVELSGAKGEKVGLEYDETAKAGQPLPLIFVGESGDPTGKVILAKPDKA
jgi:hypothetical protein